MEELKELVKKGDAGELTIRIKYLVENGLDPETILKKGLIPAMDETGELFQKGEYFLPEMLIAARAMKQGLAILKPKIVQNRKEFVGKIIIGTVRGDMHDIGKNLVGMTLEGAGFEVIDLGVDVSPEKFVNSIKEHKALAVGLSALLTSTMQNMNEAIKKIRENGLRDQVKIMIGGAPVTKRFAEEIGADFYGSDSIAAKNYIKELMDLRS